MIRIRFRTTSILIILLVSLFIVGCSKSKTSEYISLFENAKSGLSISDVIEILGKPSKTEEDTEGNIFRKNKYYWYDREITDDFSGTIMIETIANNDDKDNEDKANRYIWTPNRYDADKTEKLIEYLKDRYKDNWDKDVDDDGNASYYFYHSSKEENDKERVLTAVNPDDESFRILFNDPLKSMGSEKNSDTLVVKTVSGNKEMIFTKTDEETDISARELTEKAWDSVKELLESDFDGIAEALISGNFTENGETISIKAELIGDAEKSGETAHVKYHYDYDAKGESSDDASELFFWEDAGKSFSAIQHDDGEWSVSESYGFDTISSAIPAKVPSEVTLPGLQHSLYEDKDGHKCYVCICEKDDLQELLKMVFEYTDLKYYIYDNDFIEYILNPIIEQNDIRLILVVDAETEKIRCLSLDADNVHGTVSDGEGFVASYMFDDLQATVMLEDSSGKVPFPEINDDEEKQYIYEMAIKLAEEETSEGLIKAIELFGWISSYQDSEDRKKESEKKLEEQKKEIYEKAVSLSDKESPEELSEAIELFESVSSYQDSEDRKKKTEEKLEKQKREIYEKAIALSEKETLEELSEAVELFESISSYEDSESRRLEAEEKLENKRAEAERERIIQHSVVGDSGIEFGMYIQDEYENEEGYYEDTYSPIMWKVLAVEDDRILLISEYGLDCKVYNDIDADNTTWETCSLREWLNNEFLNTAFSNEEAERIIKTTVTAHENPEYDSDSGNNTEDKVFLLSIEEVEELLPSDDERICEPSEYAYDQGAYINDDSFGGYWWLRSPGDSNSCAAYVDTNGVVCYSGCGLDDSENCVRPALWISK